MSAKHKEAKDRLKGNEHRTRAPIVAHELEPELLQLEAGPFSENVLPVEELRLDSFTPPTDGELEPL